MTTKKINSNNMNRKTFLKRLGLGFLITPVVVKAAVDIKPEQPITGQERIYKGRIINPNQNYVHGDLYYDITTGEVYQLLNNRWVKV